MQYSYLVASAGILIPSALAMCTTTVPLMKDQASIDDSGKCVFPTSTVTNTRTIDCGGCAMTVRDIGGLGLECRGSTTGTGVWTVQTAVCASSTGGVTGPTTVETVPTSTGLPITLNPTTGRPIGTPSAGCSTHTQPVPCPAIAGYPCPPPRVVTHCPSPMPTTLSTSKRPVFHCDDIDDPRCGYTSKRHTTSGARVTTTQPASSTTCIPEMEVFGASVRTIKACPESTSMSSIDLSAFPSKM